MNEFSLKELLEMAIKAEIGVREFYKSMAANVDMESFKKKLKFLAEEERKHEILLRKLYAQTFPGEELIFPKEQVGPELKPVASKLEKIQDIIDLVRWVMKSEDIASKLYETLENMADTEEKRRLMCSLSDMEKGHYYTLRAEYELLLNWGMYSQMMHVGP